MVRIACISWAHTQTDSTTPGLQMATLAATPLYALSALRRGQFSIRQLVRYKCVGPFEQGEPSAPLLTVSLSALASAGSSLSSVVQRAAQVRLLSLRRSRALLLPRERWRCGWTKRRFDGMICSSSAP